MAESKKLAGVVYLKIDGEGFDLTGDVEAPLYTENRESIIDITGKVVGYKSTYVAPYISGTFVVPKNFPMKRLFEQQDMTVTTEFANGMVYTLSGAWLVGETPYNATEGTVALRFEGESSRWN
ncbi:MAG: phage tail tube protein [Oxalobacter formigenes]|nr:phage tail tube protein [Oxalobacter formigenes]